MMFFHNFCLVHATVAEHLTGINKIYPISGLCSGAYLLALGHLSSLRMPYGQISALVQL